MGKRRKNGHLRGCKLNVEPLFASCGCFQVRPDRITEEDRQWAERELNRLIDQGRI